MDYKIVYTKNAEKDLSALLNDTVVRILKKMSFFINSSNPFKYSSELKGFKTPTYRFRVGDYRVIFRKDKKTQQLIILVVLKVYHRKSVYK